MDHAVFVSSAGGYDDGPDLEDQGGHFRQCLWCGRRTTTGVVQTSGIAAGCAVRAIWTKLVARRRSSSSEEIGEKQSRRSDHLPRRKLRGGTSRFTPTGLEWI